MNDIEFRQGLTISRLEAWIKEHERPPWLSWLGSYPAEASVNASKAQLKALVEMKNRVVSC
jgi:hypothetical protein